MSNDQATEYAQAFYGGTIPTSQASSINQSIMKLVMTFQTDIKEKVKDIDPVHLHAATISGLYMLHELGARHPNIHKAEGSMYVQAFQHALSKLRELKVKEAQAAEQRAAEVEVAEKIAIRSKAAAAVYDYFSEVKAWAFKQGYEYPALEAWKTLIKSNRFEMAGYTYFLIVWKIPHENLIKEGSYPITLYDHPEVIEIMNNDPRLPDRNGPSRMEINSQTKGFIL